ncbi:MAG TPA: HNH endonuclease signature motif containing protein, partial [Acidimicrobiales bacterium]
APLGVAEVLATAEHLSSLMDRLDPAVVMVSDAMTMLEAFSRIERMGASGKTLVAPRATASSRLLKHKGFRDPADYLARTLDITAGEAMAILATAEVLDGLDATTDAAKKGSISPRKTLAVAAAAKADPEAEQEMLDLAGKAPLKEVQERSRQVRREASTETDEQRAEKARRRRNVWHRIDPESGDGKGGWQLPVGAHTEVVAELNRIANRYFDQARHENHRESPGAYMADALVELIRSPAAPRVPTAATGDPPAGEAEQPAKARSRRNARPIYRIDATAIDRGQVLPGERCEAAGVGPIGVTDAVELTVSDAFKVVVATDPDDHNRISSIAQLGRKALDPATLIDDLRSAIETKGIDVAALINPEHRPTAAQESAVMWLSGGRCQIGGCTSGTGRLEIDHVDPYATSRHTTLEHLALLCGHCHDLKTYDGWTVGPLGPDGKRDLTPPPPRAHPPPPDTS